VVEVIAYGMPVGVGSYVQSDRRLDARLAGALMGIQAMKGVEIGDGFRTARRRGSAAHDEMVPGAPVTRLSNRAGGIEGGHVAQAQHDHGRGIGRAMMEHAREECCKAGCYKFALSSNLNREDAHRFYDSLGFERHGYSFRVEL